MTSREKVLAFTKCETEAVEYPNGWAVVERPFAPDNVGAKKIGFGLTEAEAWDDAANQLPSAPSPAEAATAKRTVRLPDAVLAYMDRELGVPEGARSRPYRESLLRDLRDPKEAIAYLSASIEDSPEMYAKALSNIFAAQVAAPDSASLVLVPRNPTPEMFAAAGGKSIANYVWRKMIAAWEDRIE